MENLDFNIEHWQDKKCPPINCHKNQCKCGLEKVFLPSALGDDSKNSPIAPKNGSYCNKIVVYEANGHIYIYSKEGIPTLMTSGGGGDYDEIIKEIQDELAETENNLAQEVLDRGAADDTLQEEIDAIKNSPDVVDIVPTYAALQAYDTSKLGDNDIVRVLADEQHDGASTYYRWNKQSSTWTYIGEVGDYYTKSQVDNLLDDKQDTLTAGANITIDANNEISATDTTYTHFTGATASTDGIQGLVPGPLAGDENKFLKADGTWATAGGGGIKTLTTADYNYPVNNPTYINLGLFDPGIYFVDDNARIYDGHNAGNYRSSYTFVVTGGDGDSTIRNIMVIYPAATASSDEYKIRFFYTFTSNPYPWSTRGNVLSADYITNNLTTNNATRALSAAQGRTLKNLIDGLIISGAGAPTTSTAGTVGRLYEDTTNGKLYQCTAVSGSTYTWSEIGAGGGGGGPTVVQTTGTSTTDVMSQDATTKLIYPDIANYPYKMGIGESTILGTNKALAINGIINTGINGGSIAIGATDGSQAQIGQNGRADQSVAIGNGASVGCGMHSVAIGTQAFTNSGQNTGDNVALGYSTNAGVASANNTVALGAYAQASRTGEVNIGTGSNGSGYNSTNYRVLGGVHDGQLAQDAVTVNQVNSVIDAINTALSTNIPHIGA